MNVDPTTVFFIAAAIVLIGFAADRFFRRSGVPPFLFLIFAGVLLGPVFKLISESVLLPVLSTLAALTLMMVLFYGGIDVNLKTLLETGSRVMAQVLLYVSISTTLIAAFANYFLGWGWPQSLIFGAILGGETTAAVMVPITKTLNLRPQTKTFLTLESALNSIFSVILFIAFVGLYQANSTSISATATSLVSNFSIGIVLGIVMSILWVMILNYEKRNKYTYVLTMGFIFLTYAISTAAGGSGFLSVLIFGIFLGNNGFIGNLLRRKINMHQLEKRLADFQGEMSFLLETFFFVLLGIIFSITLDNLIFGLLAGGAVTVILLVVRSVSVSASTFRSVMGKDRNLIIMFCAMGLTPATLAFLALSDGIPLASSFVQLVTYVIIFTNLITTIGAYAYFKKSRRVSAAQGG